MPFRDYLFESGLPSYAKQFISFQAMAARHPTLVRLVPYERLMRHPSGVLTTIARSPLGRPAGLADARDALHLARREHMKAIEAELGHSLDGTRTGGGSHIRQAQRRQDPTCGSTTRRTATQMALLRGMGLDTDLFEWPYRHRNRLVLPHGGDPTASRREFDASSRRKDQPTCQSCVPICRN